MRVVTVVLPLKPTGRFYDHGFSLIDSNEGLISATQMSSDLVFRFLRKIITGDHTSHLPPPPYTKGPTSKSVRILSPRILLTGNRNCIYVCLNNPRNKGKQQNYPGESIYIHYDK